MYGKIKRLNKLFNEKSGRTILVPMDHGATVGPIKGIENICETVQKFDTTYVNGIVLCKGLLNNIDLINKCKVPIIMHLSNSSVLSPNENFKTIVGSVESAVALGADAVSVHVNIGDINEPQMLKDFSVVADDCFRWGMPLLAMMYVRGGKEKEDINSIKIAARIAQEIGADIVKVNFTDIETFSKVVSGVNIPVVVAGGAFDDLSKTLYTTKDIIAAGAAGISFGRRIFQHEDPATLIKALSMLVHDNLPIETVKYKILKVANG